jgi:hypothetical protein
MSASRRTWLIRKPSPKGKLMIRCTTYLTLTACVLAVPAAGAQQPGQGTQDQSRPAGVIRGWRPLVEWPSLTPPAPPASPYLGVPLGSPYAGQSYAGTPYAYGQYAGDGYGGAAGEGSYGTSGRAGNGDSTGAAASSGGGSARAMQVILNASGVPNQNGQVAWPLGLRLLRADAQLQQLEAQLQLAVEQVTAGGANPDLLDEIRLNIEDLRRLLLADREWRFSMPLAVYEDAELFLQTLRRTPKILAASAPAGRPEAAAP